METTFTERIKKILEIKNLRVAEFSRRIGLKSSNTIHLIIKENRKPSSKTINRILVAFPKINEEWLRWGVGEMYPIAMKHESITAKQVISSVNKILQELDGQERYMNTDLFEEMDKLKTGSIQIMEKFNQMEHRLDYVDDLLFQIKKNTKKIINLSKHIEAMD